MALHVLIVDDSPAMRSFIRRVVELSGVEVEEYIQAGDGAEALGLLDIQPVDIILTDINMPGMDGEQFLARVREDPLRRRIPVVVVTSDATPGRVERMLALGAQGYLTKPFLPELLREELERALESVHA